MIKEGEGDCKRGAPGTESLRSGGSWDSLAQVGGPVAHARPIRIRWTLGPADWRAGAHGSEAGDTRLWLLARTFPSSMHEARPPQRRQGSHREKRSMELGKDRGLMGTTTTTIPPSSRNCDLLMSQRRDNNFQVSWDAFLFLTVQRVILILLA